MLINNPFQLNDWKFGQFIKFILIIQALTLVIVGLNLKDFSIPIIGGLISFIYLTFLPGFLIIRVLRIHKLSIIETILYAVGLSIASIMFLGFILNMVGPMLGILDPISTLPLITTMSIFTIILCVLSYIRDRNFYNTNFIEIKNLISPIFLFLCLIPFLAIFGAYSMNMYGSNIISMLLIALIGFTIILDVFNKIPRKWYPFTIFIIAISLLYDSSLISTQIWGWDIQIEYYLANLVIKDAYWNFMIANNLNSMLSVVMLAPIYSIISNISLMWIFKLIYPLLFALVPLGLYKIFQKQTNPKTAFLACIFFVSLNTFFIEMLSLARQMIGELFLILLLLVIFNGKIKSAKILLIIFGMGLVVSHYSLTYFFTFSLILVLIMLTLTKAPLKNIKLTFFKNKKYWNPNQKRNDKLANLFILIILAIFTYLWYKYTSNSQGILSLQSLFDLTAKWIHNIELYLILIFLFLISAIIINILKFRKNHIKKEFKESYSSRIASPIISFIKSNKYHYTAFNLVVLIFSALLTEANTWIIATNRYLISTALFFILTGLILSLLNISLNKFQKEYYAFSIVTAIILLTGVMFPSFASLLNMSRIYQITFIFLSPFCVIGGIKIFESIITALKKSKPDNGKSIKFFSIFLLIFMLFNTGFFSVIFDLSIPMQLSNPSDSFPRFSEQESSGAMWLAEKKIPAYIFADTYGILILDRYLNTTVNFAYNMDTINSYIFLRKLNQDKRVLLGFRNGSRIYMDISEKIRTKNKIYDNGDAKCYYG